MPPKIFCDVGEVPKNKVRGSMKECAELGKISYWGEKKADAKMIEKVINGKKKKSTLKDLEQEYGKLTVQLAGKVGRLSRINKELPYEKDEKKVKEYEKEKKEIEKEKDVLRDKIIKIKTQLDKERNKKEKSKEEPKNEFTEKELKDIEDIKNELEKFDENKWKKMKEKKKNYICGLIGELNELMNKRNKIIKINLPSFIKSWIENNCDENLKN